MYMSRRNAKSICLYLDITIPASITQDRSREIAQKLRVKNATREERDELFLGHLALAAGITGKYVKVCGMVGDELFSEATLAIAMAIEEAPSKLVDDNFTWFCTAKIHSRLMQTWEKRKYVEDFVSACHAKIARGQQRMAHRAIQLMDDILGLAANETEEQIIKLRAEGYTDEEVAQKIGVPRREVNRIRQKIEERFKCDS